MAGTPGIENAFRYLPEAAIPHNNRFIQFENFIEETNFPSQEWKDKLDTLMEDDKWEEWENSILA